MRMRWLVVLLALAMAIPVTGVLAAGASREDPIPFGKTGRVGDWQLEIVDVDLDAYALLSQDSDVSIAPAPSGTVYVLIRLKAKYLGDEAGDLGLDIVARAVGSSDIAYDYRDFCSDYPDSAFGSREVFNGGSIEANYCLNVSASDADSLVVYFGAIGADRRYFSLEEAGGTPVASPVG